MDYLAKRVKELMEESRNLDWNTGQKDFVSKLLKEMEDHAVVIDDLVDAADELDMRISDLEEKSK